MQNTWVIVKNKGSTSQLRAQSTAQSRDEGPWHRSFHISLFLIQFSHIVQNFYFITNYSNSGREEKERTKKKKEKRKKERIEQKKEKRKKKKKKKANTKSPRERERERESHLCEAKYLCNCVGDLVVWHINKVFDFSIFLLLLKYLCVHFKDAECLIIVVGAN